MLAATDRNDHRAAEMNRVPATGVPADRLVIAAFMLVHVASAVSGASGYDTARDVAEAYAISHLQAFPLHGPLLGGALHLGPLWFYLLALPLALHESWLAVALFVGMLCSLQVPLAYAAGRRLLDRRLGLLWCALLALPGWGTFALVGFGHTSAVPLTTMLVVYALVRLAQERHPAWLVLAVFAWMLALHAHPATMPLALAIAVVAAYVLPDRGMLVRWGVAALALAALPLLPLAFEQSAATALERPGEYVENMLRLSNLANLPALFYGVLVRGPRVIADAFFAWSPGVSSIVGATVLAIEGAAVAGLVAALRTHRALALVGLALVAVVAGTIALVRPATPFYLTYALLPLLAGVGAIGLHGACELLGARGAVLSGALIAVLLALHAGSVAGIARATAAGRVTMALVPRLDVKHDDTESPQAETWLPAYAVGRSGRLLCSEPGTVVLHGTYAYLADSYFGLDYRLQCGAHDVRLVGAEPERAAHLVGLSLPLWDALGWRPAVVIGGLGVAPVARVIAPREGHAVPNGLVYPPYTIPGRDARAVQLDAVLPGDEVLVISFPFRAWLPEPVLRVTSDGAAAPPLARDAVSVVYGCRACAASAAVNWRIEFETPAPEWIDVVSLKPFH